ncbi:MAG: response regulator, partial [Rhodothermales bacterium]
MKDSTSLSALIVDDEPPARRRLRKLLSPYVSEGRIRIVGEAGDGVEALDLLESEGVDVLFLDIQMPELSGFELLDRLDASRRPTVIFTTAYNSYALQAFEANAIDYLLKPISKERLAESIQRAHRLVHGAENRGLNDERLGKLLDYIDARRPGDENRSASKDHVRQLSVPY